MKDLWEIQQDNILPAAQKETITIRASLSLADYLTRTAGNKTRGASQASLAYYAIRELTLAEIKLHQGVVHFLIDLVKLKEEPCSRGVLYAHVKERAGLQDLSKEFWVVESDIYVQLNGLTAAQLYFLQEEIILWAQNPYKDKSIYDRFTRVG